MRYGEFADHPPYSSRQYLFRPFTYISVTVYEQAIPPPCFLELLILNPSPNHTHPHHRKRRYDYNTVMCPSTVVVALFAVVSHDNSYTHHEWMNTL